MCDKETWLTHLQRLTIWLGVIVELGLALAFAYSQAEAANLSSNLGSILPLEEVSFEGYAYTASAIRIDPPAPSPNDVIRITVSGEWPNMCVPRYQSHRIKGNTIRIDAVGTLFGICIAVCMPMSWSLAVEVGPLPVGLYTVEFYILDPVGGPIGYNSTSFLVATERIYLHLPVILHNY